jgi:ribosomal-protein-alanine N-acetyltransferase
LPIPLPIETERLVVRVFRPESDAEAMLDVYGDPEVMRFIPGGALDLDGVRATLESHARDHATRGLAFWAVVERETGRVIGDVGFGIFQPTGDVELGYTFARSGWGRGYATEAAEACLTAGFEHLSVRRIVAVVDVGNESSLRLAERIGMARIETIHAHGRPHVLLARELDPEHGEDRDQHDRGDP